MKTKIAIAGLLIAAAMLLPSGTAAIDLTTLTAPIDDVIEIYNEDGEIIWMQMTAPEDSDLIKTVHYLRIARNGAKPGGGGPGPGTDCTSTAYRLTGWHWTAPYSAKAASYASQMNTAANTWDAATGASISGGITSGDLGTAGVYDGINQIAWVSLGASTTVAVTTTWSYRGSGQAVESDGQYNTYYPWSTNGAPGTMDVLNVATHEVGHTFGLDHPNGNGANCLTMYAYVNYGETHARTLGDGDILGIRAIYGN